MNSVYVIDIGVGNIQSLINTLTSLHYTIHVIRSPSDFNQLLNQNQNQNQNQNEKKVIFPGVGNFGAVMEAVEKLGIKDLLSKYLHDNRPFLGICVGMQSLFQSSEESLGVNGFSIIPSDNAKLKLFTVTPKDNNNITATVPHMGWNGIKINDGVVDGAFLFQHRVVNDNDNDDEKVYFVHSYYAELNDETRPYTLASTNYAGVEYISVVKKGNVMGVQFHPEKSGAFGISILKSFVEHDYNNTTGSSGNDKRAKITSNPKPTTFCHRIIAALDVRSNDAGDLVVTKGDQYDVREKSSSSSSNVRNLGKPVELAKRYFEEGADEIAFLNITSFRNFPLKDTPMLELLKEACKHIFVPITVGGGIRDFTDENGIHYTALQVADQYFRCGADKISIGSDAVLAAEEYIANGRIKTGKTSIEQISSKYGVQAVVVSIDPRRVYVKSPSETKHHVVQTKNGEYCWYQCTIKGGRENRDIGAYELAIACEELGAGEIMLNCIDNDGTNKGYDCDLISDIKSAVTIPVIASSGAGKVEHFSEVFKQTHCDAALAAGIFHRNEVSIKDVKKHLSQNGIDVRL